MSEGFITRKGGLEEKDTPVEATGGNESLVTINNVVYKVHEFNTVGNHIFNVTSGGEVEYLVIAGGGSGAGRYYGGGGGAGGYRSSVIGEFSGSGVPAENPISVSPGDYNVTVGAGGSPGGVRTSGRTGEDSAFGPIVSLGGGGAAKTGSFGSGGGSGSSYSGVGTGTPGQGTDGANKGGANNTGGGGGGGAAAAAAVGSSGKGGDGLSSSITGTFITRGGGGAGAMDANKRYYVGQGGDGGGGNAGADYSGSTVQPEDGDPNTGGGGGGGCWNNTPVGGDGGSGVVIVRYPLELSS